MIIKYGKRKYFLLHIVITLSFIVIYGKRISNDEQDYYL